MQLQKPQRESWSLIRILWQYFQGRIRCVVGRGRGQISDKQIIYNPTRPLLLDVFGSNTCKGVQNTIKSTSSFGSDWFPNQINPTGLLLLSIERCLSHVRISLFKQNYSDVVSKSILWYCVNCVLSCRSYHSMINWFLFFLRFIDICKTCWNIYLSITVWFIRFESIWETK